MGLTSFGRRGSDSPGRLRYWERHGVEVYLDYAHNPAGLTGLLDVAWAGRRSGRLAVLLGHAGDRSDEQLRELARITASYQPACLVLKDTLAHLRGRQPGEVPAIMRAELLRIGVDPGALREAPNELAGARILLDWATSGDVVVLQALEGGTRSAIDEQLDPDSEPNPAH
jgi:UDP-N-acetylmuramyl tripeptide synthase